MERLQVKENENNILPTTGRETRTRKGGWRLEPATLWKEKKNRQEDNRLRASTLLANGASKANRETHKAMVCGVGLCLNLGESGEKQCGKNN